MLKTFPKGGVHPHENKITSGKKIEYLPVPETAIIPLSQHIGAPSVPVVNKGDKVLTGQLIAKASGFVSANIHSSVSGTVVKIENLPGVSGYKQTSVVIEVSGDEWLDTIDRDPGLRTEISYDAEEIIGKCLDAGIVGLGGATFPTHVKLQVPHGRKCNLLIINGVECEPFLTSDHRLMLERGEEIITGTRIIMKALGVDKAIIGIENNKQDAIRNLRNICMKQRNIEVHALKVKYPQGGEKQLIKALTGREVPSGGLPLDVRVIVQNAGTAFSIYEAVQKNKPLIERVVTITGKDLANPGNYIVRIGTQVRNLVEAAGGTPENIGKVINGGPMMGKALNRLDIPVVKGTSGVLLFPENESERDEILACVRCGRCVTACPMSLEPYLLMTLAEKELFERAEKEHITDCMECGSCSYICPSRRPLLDYIRLGKSKVMKMVRERNIK